jgi:hypothetical protein
VLSPRSEGRGRLHRQARGGQFTPTKAPSDAAGRAYAYGNGIRSARGSGPRERGAGVVSLAALEAALPPAATVADMDAAFAWLAERSIRVEDGPTDLAEVVAVPPEPAPVALGPLLGSEFGLSRLLEAAAPDAVRRSSVFAASEPAEIDAAVERVAQLRAAHAEEVRLRETLGAKKLSAVKRREVRAAARNAARATQHLLSSLPLSDEWTRGFVAQFRRAGEELERSRAALDDLGKQFGMSTKDLRRALRDSREDAAARRRLAERLRLTVEDTEQLDSRVRELGRAVLRQQDILRMPADQMLKLLAVAREWESRNPVRRSFPTTAERGWAQDTRPVRFDLPALAARLEALAPNIMVATSLPTVRRKSAKPRNLGRVALAAGPSATAPSGEGGATYAELGRAGERLIFAMVSRRWESAARADAGRTAELLRRIVREYWDAAEEQVAALDAALAGRPEGWLSSRIVRDLLWPAQTLYGDAMGFDIFGVEDGGDGLLCVEVKTTLGPAATQFELTANELDRARAEGSRYVIARVSRVSAAVPEVHFWRDPAALAARGVLRLVPASFTASFG